MYAIIDNKKYRVYLKNGRYFIMKRNVVKQSVNESDVVNEPVSPPKKRTNRMLDLKILKENEEKLLGIIENLKMVSGVILFNDDNDTAIEAIKNVKLLYPNDSIIFANGGDRNAINVPETTVPNILFKFGVGGNSKINSSSDLLEQWVNFKNNN